jgi:hypothetical protein
MSRNTHVESDDVHFSADAYTVKGDKYRIAYRVLGWQTEPDEDTEWSGCENRTGMVVAVMIGDDRRHIVDESDLVPIKREEYCGECGQIGCGHDGLDRSED